MFRRIAAILAVALLAGALHAQTPAPKLQATTPEERGWIITAAADLEANPMGTKASDERSRMLFLLLERSDIGVSACMTLLADVDKHDKDNYPVLIQVLYSSASYAVQHHGGNPASLDQSVYGVEGALKIYEKFLQARPEDREPKLDAVIALRNSGKLRAYVAQRAAACR